MKKIINGMLLSASALAFAAAPVFAQTTTANPAPVAADAQACNVEVRDKLYNEDFKGNYKADTSEKYKLAGNAAKQYLEKYNAPNCTDNGEIVKYLEGWVAKYPAKYDALVKQEKLAKVNAALTANDMAGFFAAGKEFTAAYPDDQISVSVMLTMADNGFIQTNEKKVDTYNADTIATAKMAIEKINAGKTPVENSWKPFASKDDALAWLNYNIAYINLYKTKDAKAAVPYFYQVTKYNSPDLTGSYVPYKAVGDVYLDQMNAAVAEYNKNKDLTEVSEAKKDELNGMWKGYADRALEAYGIAYAKAKANTKTKPEVLKDINETLTSLYQLRRGKEATGLDAYVSSLSGKSLTDPATPVTPVVEAATPATTTPTTSGAATTTATPADNSTASKTTATTPATNGTAATKPAAQPKPAPAPKKNN